MAAMEWTLELVLIALLGATLFQAIRLERALGMLKRDRASLEALVVGFNASTHQAESGIARLRAAADGAGRQIEAQIAKSVSLKDDLAFLTERGDRLADRLDMLVRAARPLVRSDRRGRGRRPTAAGQADGCEARNGDKPGGARPAASAADGTLMLKVPAPRLLPATIASMAALLVLKSVLLVQAAVTHSGRPDAVMVTVANAASTERAKRGTRRPRSTHAQPERRAEHAQAGRGRGSAGGGTETGGRAGAGRAAAGQREREGAAAGSAAAPQGTGCAGRRGGYA